MSGTCLVYLECVCASGMCQCIWNMSTCLERVCVSGTRLCVWKESLCLEGFFVPGMCLKCLSVSLSVSVTYKY